MATSGWAIRTDHLLIRDFRLSDIDDAFLQGLNDKRHMQHSGQGLATHTMESQSNYVRSFIGTPHFLLALQMISGAKDVIGSMTVYFEHGRRADIGIFILPGYATRGFGKESWCAVVNFLAGSGRVDALTAGTARSNVAMQRLLSTSSFVLVEVVERALTTLNGLEDAIYYKRDTRKSG